MSNYDHIATNIYEEAYRSMPPVDFGSAAVRRVLVSAIATGLRNSYERGVRDAVGALGETHEIIVAELLARSDSGS